MRRIVCLFCAIILAIAATAVPQIAFASSGQDQQEAFGEILELIDFSTLDEFSKSEGFSEYFPDGIKGFVEDNAAQSGFDLFKIIFELQDTLHAAIKKYLPLSFVILFVVLALSVINNFRPTIAKDSISSIIGFSSGFTVGGILLFLLVGLIVNISSFVRFLSTVLQLVFPILLTLLSSLGATGAVAAFEGCSVIFGSGVSFLMSYLVIPAVVVCSTLSVMSSSTGGRGLSGTSSVIIKAIKSIVALIFFIFGIIVAVQGVVVSVQDSVAVRLAKFSMSKYVPVIGGYLSTGFNYLFASTVLIKNSLGLAFVVMFTVALIPILVELVVFVMMLKCVKIFSTALEEKQITCMIDGIYSGVNLLITALVGTAVCALMLCGGVVTSCSNVF